MVNTPIDWVHERTPDGRYVWTAEYQAAFLARADEPVEPLDVIIGGVIVITTNEHGL